MTFWIGVACSDHVRAAVEGGIAQLGHGKHAPVKRLRPGDRIAYYSPTTTLGGGDRVRAFTALGRIVSDQAYEADQGNGFHPWRVDVAYATDAREAPVQPLLHALDLTRGRGRYWGMAFRAGTIRATDADLATIAAAMGVVPP